MRWIGAAVLMAFGTSANTAEWRLASTGPHASAYVDTASLKRNGDVVRFWSDYVELHSTNRKYDETKQYNEANCSSKYLNVMQSDYYLSGKFVREDIRAEGSYVIPGSLADAMLEQICSATIYAGSSYPDPNRAELQFKRDLEQAYGAPAAPKHRSAIGLSDKKPPR